MAEAPGAGHPHTPRVRALPRPPRPHGGAGAAACQHCPHPGWVGAYVPPGPAKRSRTGSAASGERTATRGGTHARGLPRSHPPSRPRPRPRPFRTSPPPTAVVWASASGDVHAALPAPAPASLPGAPLGAGPPLLGAGAGLPCARTPGRLGRPRGGRGTPAARQRASAARLGAQFCRRRAQWAGSLVLLEFRHRGGCSLAPGNVISWQVGGAHRPGPAPRPARAVSLQRRLSSRVHHPLRGPPPPPSGETPSAGPESFNRRGPLTAAGSRRRAVRSGRTRRAAWRGAARVPGGRSVAGGPRRSMMSERKMSSSGSCPFYFCLAIANLQTKRFSARKKEAPVLLALLLRRRR